MTFALSIACRETDERSYYRKKIDEGFKFSQLFEDYHELKDWKVFSKEQ